MVHEVVSRHRHQKRPRSHLPLVLGPLGAGRRTCCPREERRYCPQGEQRRCPQGEHRSLCTRPCHYRRHRHILHTLVGVDGETYGRLRVVLCVWWCCGGVVVGRGVLRFKKGVCSKRVSGSVVLEAFSSRARFICTTVVQIGVAGYLCTPIFCRKSPRRVKHSGNALLNQFHVSSMVKLCMGLFWILV